MISISTVSRYAARMLVFIALRMMQGIEPVSRREIACVEEITPDYAEQILIKLKAGGLIRSHRGARGGYTLMVDPHEITFADIVKLLEGDIRLSPCSPEECSRFPNCLTRPVWENAGKVLMAELERTSIGELAEKAKAREEVEENKPFNFII
jgi:Rrf2 family protein